VLYPIVQELKRYMSSRQACVRKVCYLPGDFGTSALDYSRDKARFISCERVTEYLVRQLVETCRCCIPRVTSGQVFPEMTQRELELDFCCRSFPRA
jgi:hypothetical protein